MDQLYTINNQIIAEGFLKSQNSLVNLSDQIANLQLTVNNLSSQVQQLQNPTTSLPGLPANSPTGATVKTYPNGNLSAVQKNTLAAVLAFGIKPFGNVDLPTDVTNIKQSTANPNLYGFTIQSEDTSTINVYDASSGIVYNKASIIFS